MLTLSFIQDEEPTGCCIAVQIKSGDSYVKSNGDFFLKANKDHFEYWYSHALPIATVVYSPERDYAVWADITEYLSQHSNVVETGPYNIEIPASQEFSSTTFERFASHFLKYLEPYRHKFGVALEKFADRENSRNCLDGIKYLFSFQRQSVTGWYYVISCFQNFRRHRLLFQLIDMLAYLPGHEDIFWHKDNMIQDQTRDAALDFLKERFGRVEVLTMLEAVTDGGGFARGAIGQRVLVIVSYVRDREKVLESIAFDPEIDEDVRYWALLLLVYFMQHGDSGTEECMRIVARHQHLFPDGETAELVSGIQEELKTYRRFHLIC